MIHFVRKNWFLIGLAAVLALALAAPGLVRAMNPGGVTSAAAVMIVFFLSGLTLPAGDVLEGVRQVRVHVFVQLFVFVVAPIFFLVTATPLRGLWGADIHVGIMALAALPTTISSCIVFTQLAAGSTAVALFNTVLANLAGVVLSPLILAALLRESELSLSQETVWRVFLSLMIKVLAPFVAGQALRVYVGPWAQRNRRRFGTFSSLCLLLIILLGVAKGAERLRQAVESIELPVCFAYLAVAHITLLLLAAAGIKLMRFRRANAVAALFASSQKTLALGVPLITTAFADSPNVGLMLVPLLFYHPWMLFTAGMVLHTPLARPPEEDDSP